MFFLSIFPNNVSKFQNSILDDYSYTIIDELLTEGGPRRRYRLPDQHDTKLRIPCSCGRTFLYKKHLNFHQRWECGRIFKCRSCDNEFTTKSYLKTHWNKFHMPKKEDFDGADFKMFF